MSVEAQISTSRFSTLLQRAEGVVEPYDRPLYTHEDWVVAPTLGAIVPNWLIIIPKDFALSFRSWRGQHSVEPMTIVRKLCGHIGLGMGDVIWFEHGPAAPGTSVGCGTDHAHIHVILKPRFSLHAFLDQAESMSELTWNRGSVENCYQSLPEQRSYLIAGSGSVVAWATDVESTGSQFFRRVVSSVSGLTDSWDYKQFAHMQNIAQTIETFRSLESAERRGK